MIKAVIFDWFNTLARYEPPRELVHSRALAEYGIKLSPEQLILPLADADKYFFEQNAIMPVRKRSVEEQEQVYINYEAIIMDEAGLKSYPANLPAMVYHKGKELFGDILDFVLFDDVLPTLRSLKERKLTLGLLTNYARDMSSLINRLGLASLLDFVVTPYDAGADKPDPQIFYFALGKAGVKAAEAIYIGDQYQVDIVGAKSAGITALLIDHYKLNAAIKDCPRLLSLAEVVNYLTG